MESSSSLRCVDGIWDIIINLISMKRHCGMQVDTWESVMSITLMAVMMLVSSS